MYNGNGVSFDNLRATLEIKKHAYIRIVEEPASKAIRFRYSCEGRSVGSGAIPGVNSTPSHKTFPTIQVVGYTGRAKVVVSCVTKDPPYRPHPHMLVGREGCKNGICLLEIPSDTMTLRFTNLGIQCVKKKDIADVLKVRREKNLDPFKTGFSHIDEPNSIDQNAIRLCFQVMLEREPGKFTIPLYPVVSQPIYDKKATPDLTIVELSDCEANVDGGKKIILLCAKVAKDDIQVRFFEKKGDQVVWEGFGDFHPSQVYKQNAISFTTPKYHMLDICEPVNVSVQLRRPSDGATSEPLPFQLLPLIPGPSRPKRKRCEVENWNIPVVQKTGCRLDCLDSLDTEELCEVKSWNLPILIETGCESDSLTNLDTEELQNMKLDSDEYRNIINNLSDKISNMSFNQLVP